MCIDSVVSKDIVNECLLNQLAICTIIAYLRLNIVRRRPLVNLVILHSTTVLAGSMFLRG